MELINLDQAIGLAEQVVQERGADYIYINPDGESSADGADCRNWDCDADQPSCVVGWILYRAGVPKEELIRANDEDVYVFKNYLEDGDDGKTFVFLSHLQNCQDMGETWGDSLEKSRQIVQLRQMRVGVAAGKDD